MEVLKVPFWFLLCWVICATSRGDELLSRDVEEKTALTMECHPLVVKSFTSRYWYGSNVTRGNPGKTADTIYHQIWPYIPKPQPKHRIGMRCDETTFTLTINRVLLEDTIFTCRTDYRGVSSYTQHPINVYRVGRLEMTGLEADDYITGDVVTVSCKYSSFYPEIDHTKLNIQWGRDAPVISVNKTAAGEKYFTYTASIKSRTLVKVDNNTAVHCSVMSTVGLAPSPIVKILNVHYRPSGRVDGSHIPMSQGSVGQEGEDPPLPVPCQ